MANEKRRGSENRLTFSGVGTYAARSSAITIAIDVDLVLDFHIGATHRVLDVANLDIQDGYRVDAVSPSKRTVTLAFSKPAT